MIDLTEEDRQETEEQDIQENSDSPQQHKPKSKEDMLLDAVSELSQKVKELSEGNDLEKEFEFDDKKAHSQMLSIEPEQTDSFGDSIELITKSRLSDYTESFKIARNFVEREYHNMMGNRYGRHSKLIPVYDEEGHENKIDLVWFSGNDVKIVQIGDKLYYKIRLLVYDILTKKLLLARIPTGNGAARNEEINHKGASVMGKQWLDQNSPMNPMKPVSYNPISKGKTTMKQVGEIVVER